MLSLVVLLGAALSVTEGWSERAEVLVEAGSRAVLPCVTSVPVGNSVTVQWIKVSGSVQTTVWRIEQSGLEFRGVGPGERSDCPHSSFVKGDFSLHIDDMREEDGGEYICRAGQGKWQIQNLVTLRVIQVSFTPALPVEGSNVKVTCKVTPLLMQASHVSTGDGKLDMYHQALGKEEGKATQSLSMRGFVSPASPLTQVYAEVGSAVTLPCVATEGVTRTFWEKEQGGTLPPSVQSSNLSSHPPGDCSLSVARVEEGDGGTYRCSGTVEGRTVQRRLQLVTAQVRSRASEKSNAPVTLTCHLSDERGVTKYEWVRVTYDVNGTRRVTSLNWAKTFKIQKMTEENSGEWACRYYGKEGILGNATYHVPALSYLEGERAAGSSGKAGVITGLTFLFLVTLLIALQMYKNHRRRKMILQYPALETIVHSSSNDREQRERNRTREKEKNQQTDV
ncbi:hypothetical protein MATL_G00127930 [Megalops atlanticus]|uniref:Ig-like domain-containing protein n=1 Tax=Megalops atlanticus TaxID=7932 RepID=A0A9D3PZP8_MEGAT|nr:hypothetical protein MATL_G00127930 [Megalops atlanticus]